MKISNDGCGVLFASDSGIIICGQKRADGCQFYCRRCLKEKSLALKQGEMNKK